MESLNALHDGTEHQSLQYLSGEIDLATADDIRNRLLAQLGDVEVDCSAVTFIDSTGLSMLIHVHEELVRRGSLLIVFNPSPSVQRLLEMTGVDAVLDVRRLDVP